MSFPHPALSHSLRPGHPLGPPPVSAFCTQSLDRKWKIPSSLLLPFLAPGLPPRVTLNGALIPLSGKGAGADKREKGLHEGAQEWGGVLRVETTHSERGKAGGFRAGWILQHREAWAGVELAPGPREKLERDVS